MSEYLSALNKIDRQEASIERLAKENIELKEELEDWRSGANVEASFSDQKSKQIQSLKQENERLKNQKANLIYSCEQVISANYAYDVLVNAIDLVHCQDKKLMEKV